MKLIIIVILFEFGYLSFFDVIYYFVGFYTYIFYCYRIDVFGFDLYKVMVIRGFR